MQYIHAFLIAIALLTRIPLPSSLFPNEINDKTRSLSALFYPVVGLIIGICVGLVFYAVPFLLGKDVSELVVASVVLTFWVAITGALHLDGVADSTDAAFASHKNRERTLAVFKDPQAGPMAVVSVCLILILKFSLLSSFMHAEHTFLVLVVSTTTSRYAALFFMCVTPYQSVQGIASGIQLAGFKSKIWLIGGVFSFILLLLTSFWLVVLLFFVVSAWVYYWRRFWMKKIGGYNGDCVGALIEVAEVLCLFTYLTALS
ncbi:MAG: adenosylcobinamide-GDP ribazoletransferase [Agarilytica sp.]